MDGVNAFGGQAASSQKFDPINFIKKPQVILRVVAWLFSIIVFASIADEANTASLQKGCIFNNNANACHFAMTIGVFSFLATMGFLVLDVIFDSLSNVTHRKFAVLADLAFSGFWTFMWFVCFCLLIDNWRKTDLFFGELGIRQAKTAIAFSFFSIIPWAGLTVLAVMRYRQGAQAAFSQSYEPDQTAPPPAPQLTADDSYQQPPFAEKSAIPDQQFQAPSY